MKQIKKKIGRWEPDFKNHNDFNYLAFSEGTNKIRQTVLRKKYRVQMPKMIETTKGLCPVNVFRTYLAKHPVDLETSDSFYLAIIYNSSPMDLHTINDMKNVIKIRNFKAYLLSFRT